MTTKPIEPMPVRITMDMRHLAARTAKSITCDMCNGTGIEGERTQQGIARACWFCGYFGYWEYGSERGRLVLARLDLMQGVKP